ncbi:amino acid ABC transporter substrate-binding protein [Pseudorhodoplanes sp.]|uniref:amino acid ABC transporter substrate-binding protein n=1 Tax=Pseudorhodoplanes sp. TaxID=1934341 RepID=UPI003918F70B
MVKNLSGVLAAGAAALTLLASPQAHAQSGEPIKIGLGIAMTGGLAGPGKQALLGVQIWEEQINKKGGLLGRPVRLIAYDDQTNASTVPGLYTKLLDVDKVDLILGPYATNMIAPAMPVAMQKGKTIIGLFGLAINTEFNYPKYFAMIPTGQNTKPSFTEGFFEIAAKNKIQSVALVAADAEFANNACEGARTNAKKHNIKIVYDGKYPPPTTDFTPIVRAIQARNPEAVVICSYPPDSVGMVRAVNEVGFKPKMIGGSMVGLQISAIKTQLGPLLNGWINYETWVPTKEALNPEIQEFLKVYQERAKGAGVDPLGYYLGTWGYAYAELLGKAVEGAKSLDDDKIADYLRKNTIQTIMGPIKFGKNGEWVDSGMMQVQYKGIKGNDLDQFRGMDTQIVVAPASRATGEAVLPFEKAQQQ